MAQLLSALVIGKAGFGAVEYATFVAITALMVMFVVETVRQHS